MVVRNNFSKFGILFVIALAVMLLGISLAFASGLPVQVLQLVTALLLWAGFYLASRFFRGADEPSTARPVWKVASSAKVAGILCLLLLLTMLSQASSSLASLPVLAVEVFAFILIAANAMLLKNRVS